MDSTEKFGIQAHGDNLTIRGNIVNAQLSTPNNTIGIEFQGSFSTIHGNVLNNSETVGMSLVSGNYVTILGNTVKATGGASILNYLSYPNELAHNLTLP